METRWMLRPIDRRNGQRDGTEDGQTGGKHGLTQTAGKNEEGNEKKKLFSLLFPLFSSFTWSSFPAISHSFLSLTLYSAI
jgi:hypothetical protein